MISVSVPLTLSFVFSSDSIVVVWVNEDVYMHVYIVYFYLRKKRNQKRNHLWK